MADKKEKKVTKKETKKPLVDKSLEYKITKSNGGVIFRKDIGEYKKVYESKGWKVEEV